MKIKNNSLSLLVAFLILMLFSWHFLLKIDRVVKNQDTCICTYDGLGYYMYLPSLINNGTLNMQPDWLENLQNSYCDTTIPIYQLHPVENNKYVNIYHMGLALVQLPSYLVADQFASAYGYKRDGFSKPYHIAYLINALFFIFLGVFYVRKLLLLFFSDSISTISLIILYVCSNIYPTFGDGYQLTHLYLFTLNAPFLYYLFLYTKNEGRKFIFLSALFFGISCFVRPTQAVWGIIPLILFWNKYGFNKNMLSKIAYYPVAAIVLNIPHILYWKIIGGKFFMLNLHTEEIVLIDPNFWKFLFSYRKGWLLYSPIFLLLIPGFISLYRNKKEYFWPFLSLVFINIYVLSSWECWWYASSIGSRVMIDSYPLLAILIGFALIQLKTNWAKIVGATFILGCFILNTIQIIQYKRYYLHLSHMSKQHYWYIFGKTSIENYSDYRLEIDRNDLTWPNNPEFKSDPNFEIVKKPIFELKQSLTTPKQDALTIGDIHLANYLSTDETLFDITVVCKTYDSTQSCLLKFEQTGKFNTYSWANFELSQGLPNNQWNTLHFQVNETYLRHTNDFIQMYTFTPETATVEIQSLQVTATSLIRK